MEYEEYGMECYCGADMDYIDNGDYRCPDCGSIFHDDEYDEEDSSERLSASDAADIWMSSGKDEDYMFGYTEDELEDAL